MRPSLELPRSTTVEDVANAARAALGEFLDLDPHDKFALSKWLVGPYRRATSYGPRRITPAPHEHATVSHASVSSVVEHAQDLTRAAVAAAERPGADGLLALMPAVVDVIPVHDVYGGHGFAPVDAAHAHLDARALALLLADYLSRPDEYVEVPPPASSGPRRFSSSKIRALSG
jgi:hypothetical protein